MASQNNSLQAPGQAQMRREANNSLVDQPSNVHAAGQTNFLQETGENVKTMAQGAADIGKGAISGAVNIARGAANVAQGAADAVKNTFGAAGGPANPTTLHSANAKSAADRN
ncbi:hypothetical protein DM860_010127 [Cuscuta australis]|uniref:Uncharacterized protein n=1 Tax=Cuscuta australis TaxID=267555 RepID=A0A328DBR7_9ASTE|nr:hypothetical protein DM860_010127 [Cuscuta australis]